MSNTLRAFRPAIHRHGGGAINEKTDPDRPLRCLANPAADRELAGVS